MGITQQQALAELARRELARRSSTAEEAPQPAKVSFMKQLGQSFKQAPTTLVRGVAEPIIKNVIARPLMGLESAITGQPAVEEMEYPFPKMYGGNIKVKRIETVPQGIGAGIQTSALLTGNPTIAGVMYGGGGAMEERKPAGEIVLDTAMGAGAGRILGKLTGQNEILPKGSKEVIKAAGKQIAKGPASIVRGVRKYQVSRKGSQFEGIRQDLSPIERVSNLESKARQKYGTALDQEKQALENLLQNVGKSEKIVTGKMQSDIKQNKIQFEQKKAKFAQDLDDLSQKMKEETQHLRDNIELASQKSALEGKNRFSRFARENSQSYGKKLDDIIDIAEQENKLPTVDDLTAIFEKTDDEIQKAFIDTGAPLTRYSALKNKYIHGVNPETQPEMSALSKAMGFKKGEMKNAGINWSRVDTAQSQVVPPNPNAPVNLKGLLSDIRSVKKAVSAKGQGALQAFSDEDLVATIFQKNVGEYMSAKYPEFANLQKDYAPLIEQMKAGRQIFKPGAPYDLGTAPNVIKKPNIVENKLLGEIEKGKEGFSKGVGPITRPVRKAQSKLAGVEKKYEIARQRIEQMSPVEQKDLSELLKMRQEVYDMAKEKLTARSLERQRAISESLNKRLRDLEEGSFAGKAKVSKLMARQKITGREKKIATGGGLATILDYLIRRKIAQGVMK